MYKVIKKDEFYYSNYQEMIDVIFILLRDYKITLLQLGALLYFMMPIRTEEGPYQKKFISEEG